MSVPSIVAIDIRGGLGNQLFEYSTARSLADILRADLILDCSDARDRPILLDQLQVRAKFLHSRAEIRKTWLNLPGTVGRKISKGVQLLLPNFVSIDGQRFCVVEEPSTRIFEKTLTERRGRVYLRGYWQSYRYFEDNRRAIEQDLRAKAFSRQINLDWIQRIRSAPHSVCVHIRRGDYLIRQDTFGLCGVKYYRDAMLLISSQIREPAFFVFSDDIEWCRANLEAQNLTYVDANGADQAVEELELMRTCCHHVIANSTMSWWAAWLAHSPGQIVVAPDPWFISGGPPECDLLPRHWLRLNP
jgi:Glycosyl transferase family 11